MKKLRDPLLRFLFELQRYLPLLAVAAGLCFAADALARPGGGHSYSGGGRSGGGGGGFGGGGGGGGGGDGLGILIWLLFRHPVIGVPVLIFFVFMMYRGRHTRSRERDWSTTVPVQRRAVSPRRDLERLRSSDPNFSLVLFEDFVYALYARAHELRGTNQLDKLSSYVSEGVRASYLRASQNLSRVQGVVIGAMRYTQVRFGADTVEVKLLFEANYVEVDRGGKEQTYYVVEEWQLGRALGARTRPPEQLSVFSCPNCGAATTEMRDGVCAYCKTRVDTGAFDWVVTMAATRRREARGPQLTGTVPEQGTELPTVIDPRLGAAMAELKQRDPSFDLQAFEQRVRLIHREINQAWSERDWKRARAYTSDQLFQMQLYWIETYKRAGLKNITQNAKVSRVVPAAARSDKYYDAITVRIYARGLDYTVRDSDGKLVGGSNSRERPYSEYWTLIRGTSVHKAATTTPNCPQCGAQLSVNMAGNCEYCDAKISTGGFDWVLSRIEQDESYSG